MRDSDRSTGETGDQRGPNLTAAKRSGWGLPWLILLVVLFTSLAGPINYYKVPPLMPVLMSNFHLSGGGAGLLMSTFAVVGIALSLPAGVVLQRLGYRTAGLVAAGWLVAGAGLGALSNSAIALLSTRFMEGIGLNLMALVAPTVIALHFADKRRATAIGIWNAYYPLGSTITFVVAPILASQWGWRSVWWFGSVYAFAAGLLYFFAIKPRPAESAERDPVDPAAGRDKAVGRSVFFNRDLWGLSAMFFCFSFIYVAYVTWTPTFLHAVRGVSLPRAAFIMSLFSVLVLISSLLSGWLLGRLRSPKAWHIAVLALYSVFAAAVCLVKIEYGLFLVFAMGLITSFVPAAIFTILARLMHERTVGATALSMVTIGQNTGIFFGPALFGRAIESGLGWPLAYGLFIPVGLIGICGALLLDRGGPGRKIAHKKPLV